MAEFDWPAALKFRSIQLTPPGSMRQGAEAMSGVTQIVQRPPGAWRATISGIVIRDAGTAQAYRVLLARLKRGDVVWAPVADPYGVADPAATAVVASPAAQRATTIAVALHGMMIAPGQYLSIEGRLHMVLSTGGGYYALLVSDLPWGDTMPWRDDGASQISLELYPGLRFPLAGGESPAVLRPTIRLRLPTDAADAAPLDWLKFATTELSLVEAY